MKKLLSLLLALMLTLSLALMLCACSDETPNGDDTVDNGTGSTNDELIEDVLKDTFELDFTLSDSGTYYIITGFGMNYTNPNIVIPSTYNDLPVREIRARAFTANISKSLMESIVIPSSIEKIGDFAFSECDKLKTVTMNEGLTHIGEGAFRKCAIETVIVPDTVTYIGDYAFSECSSLKSVTLSSSLSHLGKNPFRACGKIIGNGATAFEGAYTVPTSDGKCWVVSSVASKATDTTNINLPDNTVGIAADAFDRSRGLVSIDIPKSVKYIGESAFSENANLASVVYGGVGSEWIVISIGDDNIPLLEADKTYGG